MSRSCFTSYHCLINEYRSKYIISNPRISLLSTVIRAMQTNVIGTRTQDRFVPFSSLWPLVLCPLRNKLLCSCRRFSVVFSFLPTGSTHTPGHKPRTVFRGSDLCFYHPLFEAKNFCLGAVLLSCLELDKPPSPVLIPRRVSRNFDLSVISS
jgi:hypothetical protein